MSQRAAYLDREEEKWLSSLAMAQREVICCREKLAAIHQERFVLGQAIPVRIIRRDGRRWPTVREHDDG